MSALCEILGLSRASYYRFLVPRPECPVEMELRDAMQKIALESPCYGYRRITAELQRGGFNVNHKRVLRLMREDNLLCLRHKAFVVTTDSRHDLTVYPNLARDFHPTAINQLWVADITYIRLRHEFVYLAVVLDGFSRRVKPPGKEAAKPTSLQRSSILLELGWRPEWGFLLSFSRGRIRSVPSPFRPLNRCSGRIPALPYPVRFR